MSDKNVVLPTEAEIPLLTDDPMKQILARPPVLYTKWGYYKPTGEQDLEWTLAQMDEKPKSLKQFLEDNGPWFQYTRMSGDAGNAINSCEELLLAE